MLIPMIDLLKEARQGGYAVAAFNVNNLEMIEGVFRAAARKKSPVIISSAPVEINYARPEMLRYITKSLAEEYNIRAAIHLDHGDSFETAICCIRAGYTSVMYDGSHLSFEENLQQTKQVVAAAHAVGVTVEAELGRLMGIEGSLNVSEYEASLTNVKEAQSFVEQTNVDTLAVSIGSAHGFYKLEPKLDFERLDAIAKQTAIPIVLHGGTGIPVDQVQKAISLGIAKVNFSTRLRHAKMTGMKAYFKENPDSVEYMDLMNAGLKAYEKEVESCIDFVMSAHKN